MVRALLQKAKKQPDCYYDCHGLFSLLQQVVSLVPAGGQTQNKQKFPCEGQAIKFLEPLLAEAQTMKQACPLAYAFLWRFASHHNSFLSSLFSLSLFFLFFFSPLSLVYCVRFCPGLIVSQNQNKSLCVKNISRARKPKKPRFRAGKRKRKNDKSVRAQGTSCLFVTHPNEKSFSIDLWESHTHPPLSPPKADCLQAKMEGGKLDREGGEREEREEKSLICAQGPLPRSRGRPRNNQGRHSSRLARRHTHSPPGPGCRSTRAGARAAARRPSGAAWERRRERPRERSTTKRYKKKKQEGRKKREGKKKRGEKKKQGGKKKREGERKKQKKRQQRKKEQQQERQQKEQQWRWSQKVVKAEKEKERKRTRKARCGWGCPRRWARAPLS